jgi:dienelactone hydrolase
MERCTVTVHLRALLVALIVLLAGAPALAEESLLDKALNERIVFIPHGNGIELETTIFKPDGDGPFPLAVINHGKSPGDPRLQARARYIVGSRELVRRGYVVAIPMRGGFSRSSGTYVDRSCSIAQNAEQQARYVRSVLDYMTQQPYVDRTRIVVMGQSHGGLTATAFAAEPYEGVRGVISFAGGLRLTGERCLDWQQSLVDAYAKYGSGASVPSLWFYGENDSYFGPGLAKRMHEAYSRSGGRAKLIAYGPFKGDAHNTFSDRDGLAIWWPDTEAFLASVGLPTRVQPAAAPREPVLEMLADAKRVPYIKANCAGIYSIFLDADYPRAYAVSADSHCGYASGGGDPRKRALDYCQRAAREPCQLYAVDNEIVWADASRRANAPALQEVVTDGARSAAH